jgi:hypothetical protein
VDRKIKGTSQERENCKNAEIEETLSVRSLIRSTPPDEANYGNVGTCEKEGFQRWKTKSQVLQRRTGLWETIQTLNRMEASQKKEDEDECRTCNLIKELTKGSVRFRTVVVPSVEFPQVDVGRMYLQSDCRRSVRHHSRSSNTAFQRFGIGGE